MARFTFNTAAAREYFESNRLNWLRLRIERGVITLRPAAHARGDDEVIKIERRPRGIVAEIDEGRFSKRLMTRLFRAGLSEDQPYFLLAPAAYGWIGVDHLPGLKPPQRQAVMVVSNFETPEEVEAPPPRVAANTFDMGQWQRFLRAVNANRPIEATGWDDVRQMIMLAQQITAQKQRGRQSFARIAATKLLAAVQRRAPILLAWEERHPELRRQVTTLLKDLGIPVEHVAADVIHIHTRRRGRHHRPALPPIEVESVTVEDVEEVVIPDERTGQPDPDEPVVEAEQVVEAEPEDLPPPPPRRPKKRPRRMIERQDPPEPTEAETIEHADDAREQQQSADYVFPDEVVTNVEVTEVQPEPETPEPVAEEVEPTPDEDVAESSDDLTTDETAVRLESEETPEVETEGAAEADESPNDMATDTDDTVSDDTVSSDSETPETVAETEPADADEAEPEEGPADHTDEPEAPRDEPEAHRDETADEQHPGEGEQPEIAHPYQRQHVDSK